MRLGNNDIQQRARALARHVLDGADRLSKHRDIVFAMYDAEDGTAAVYARRGSRVRRLSKLTDIGHSEGCDTLMCIIASMGVAYDPMIEEFFDGSLS